MKVCRIALSAASLFAGLAPGFALAAPEEIQVYMDELSPRGGHGLDVHLNYTPDGRKAPTYAGEMASDKRWRITPEWAYGLTDNVELGLYLPLATIDKGGQLELGGVKGRIKYIAPRAANQPWFWGANFEIGRVRKSYDINPWNAELKTIAGYRSGPWTVAGNLNIDWMVSGPDHTPVSYQLATKLAYAVNDTTSLGIENYNEFADASGAGRLGDRDQQVFAVIDKTLGDWDLNLGLGYGYGAPEDRWVIKATVGVPFGK